MPDSPDRYQALLDAHLDLNPKSWAALQERGTDEQTPVQLDFGFTADDEAATRSLMRFLGTSTDYEYKGGARDQDDGTRRWMVLGQTSPMTLSLDVLNTWVETMTSYGRDHGPAVFDGWGARTPEGKAAAGKAATGKGATGKAATGKGATGKITLGGLARLGRGRRTR